MAISVTEVTLILASILIALVLLYSFLKSQTNTTVDQRELSLFEGGANANGGKLVLFFAPWCPHCTDVKPVWNKLQREYPNKVTSVNGDKHPELIRLFGVEGFPTIMYSPQGLKSRQGAVEYKGSKDYKSLKTYLMQQ